MHSTHAYTLTNVRTHARTLASYTSAKKHSHPRARARTHTHTTPHHTLCLSVSLCFCLFLSDNHLCPLSLSLSLCPLITFATTMIVCLHRTVTCKSTSLCDGRTVSISATVTSLCNNKGAHSVLYSGFPPPPPIHLLIVRQNNAVTKSLMLDKVTTQADPGHYTTLLAAKALHLKDPKQINTTTRQRRYKDPAFSVDLSIDARGCTHSNRGKSDRRRQN